MTMLEMMIVLAIIAGLLTIGTTAFRKLTKGDLVQSAVEMSAVLQRTNEMAIESGVMHRLTLDFEKGGYVVEKCTGVPDVVKAKTQDKTDPKTIEQNVADALKAAQQKLGTMPADAMAPDSPADAMRMTAALAGQHIGDQRCTIAPEGFTGDSQGRKLIRKLTGSGIKFKEVWVQHYEESVTAGQVSLFFFPNGQAEKSIVEITDGDAIVSVLVYGLSARVEVRDGAVEHPEDHLLRNAIGEKFGPKL